MLGKLDSEIEALKYKGDQLDADWSDQGRNALLRFYVKIMPMVLNAERCNIFIWDPMSKVIWLRVGTGLEEEVISVGEEDEAILGEVLNTGKHKIIHKVEAAAGIHRKIDEKAGLRTRDILAVPIMSVTRHRVAGAVEVLNKKDGTPFTEADREMLDEMAHYLEVAIESVFFNMESTRLVSRLSRLLTIAASTLLWIAGLTVLAIIARVAWVGLESVLT
jgi:GAF domain-containing protein